MSLDYPQQLQIEEAAEWWNNLHQAEQEWLILELYQEQKKYEEKKRLNKANYYRYDEV